MSVVKKVIKTYTMRQLRSVKFWDKSLSKKMWDEIATNGFEPSRDPIEVITALYPEMLDQEPPLHLNDKFNDQFPVGVSVIQFPLSDADMTELFQKFVEFGDDRNQGWVQHNIMMVFLQAMKNNHYPKPQRFEMAEILFRYYKRHPRRVLQLLIKFCTTTQTEGSSK